MTSDRERVVKVQRDMEWHEAIAKYLPQVRTISSSDPVDVIQWLFERVTVSESATAVANALKDSEIESDIVIRASGVSTKSLQSLRTMQEQYKKRYQ